jgi:hypothetical protein
MGAEGTWRRWRDDARVAEILDEGDLLYVAVTTRRGPHVTPTAFDRDGRRLWFVTPRRSVKARAIRRHRQVGALVRLGERAVMMSGRARIVDPLTARGVFSVNRLLDLPLAATGFLGRNHRHVTGTVRDHKAPTLALARVAVSVDITRLALLEGERVAATWGEWEHRELRLPGAPLDVGPPDLTGVPRALGSFLAADDQPVVLGWQTPSGPVALPARWQGATGLAETSGAAMALAGAGSAGPACVTVDRSRYRLKHKQGVLLAGTGHAWIGGGRASVAIEQERLTWWDGEETGTTLRRRDGAAGHRGAGDGQAEAGRGPLGQGPEPPAGQGGRRSGRRGHRRGLRREEQQEDLQFLIPEHRLAHAGAGGAPQAAFALAPGESTPCP